VVDGPGSFAITHEGHCVVGRFRTTDFVDVHGIGINIEMKAFG
jgi:hypothetical protein